MTSDQTKRVETALCDFVVRVAAGRATPEEVQALPAVAGLLMNCGCYLPKRITEEERNEALRAINDNFDPKQEPVLHITIGDDAE